MRFSRMVAAVKYVRVTDSEMSGPLCTQCGVPGGMYTARPGVMVYVAISGGRFSIRPWEPSQYLSISCRRAASLSKRPMLTILRPLTCISRLCSMSKWTGVTEFGEETKTNATRRRILPCLAIIPASSWSRWVFMRSAMPGSSSTLSRVSQAFALRRSRMTSPGRSRAPRGGPPCGTSRGCAAVSAITDSTRQPVGEICDGCEGQAVIEVEVMDEFNGFPGVRIVECDLCYRLGGLLWWLCTHHSPLSSWAPILCSCEGRQSATMMRALAISAAGFRLAFHPFTTLVPLVKRRGQGPMPVSYDARNGRSKWLERQSCLS